MCCGWMVAAVTAGTVHIDSFGVGFDKPLCIDDDANEVSDQYEEAYSDTGTLDPDGDPDLDGVITRLEQAAGTHPTNANSFMRILTSDLSDGGSSNIAVEFIGGDFAGPTEFGDAGDTIQRVFRIMGSDVAGGPKTPIGSMTGTFAATNIWTDTNAVQQTDMRLYSLCVEYAGTSYTNDIEWGMFVQPRAVSNAKYLVSVPVDLDADNTLDGLLGQQLARGLAPGTETTGDKLILLRDDGTTDEYVLKDAGGGQVVWWDYDAQPIPAEPTDTITPGMGMWVMRGSEAGRTRTNAVMVGRTYVSDVDPLTFNTNTPAAGWKWSLFGWPYAESISATGQVSAFGFYDDGAYGGISGLYNAAHSNRGDQIWVWDWDEQTFRDYYLIEGVPGRPELDGKWWDQHTRTNALFSFEPGKAYYYRHHVATNGAATGTNFVWQPDSP